MKLIENFYCIQTEIMGNGTEKVSQGMTSIKTELIRPSIKIINEYGGSTSSEKKEYRKKLIANPYIDPKESFTIGELSFLSKTYGFEIQEDLKYKGYYDTILRINKMYKSPGEIILIEQNEKEYLRIEFSRWTSEAQPRSAAEDSLGEDVTYIVGIWESPLLTDEIIAKIKGIK
ncbi:hypothetical protein [Flavobacterium sp. N502540]|uniref:hypothetical protein n=1 Tax=Flavobacterium sp. N502540 TaxID=2986838 RepID=UPI0022241811|nr:hypothetical protein [Flavobacterium sp. N502540]